MLQLGQATGSKEPVAMNLAHISGSLVYLAHAERHARSLDMLPLIWQTQDETLRSGYLADAAARIR